MGGSAVAVIGDLAGYHAKLQGPWYANARDPPLCADAGSVPVKTLAAQIWAFCALKDSSRTAPKNPAEC